jgi:hypothetical protein
VRANGRWPDGWVCCDTWHSPLRKYPGLHFERSLGSSSLGRPSHCAATLLGGGICGTYSRLRFRRLSDLGCVFGEVGIGNCEPEPCCLMSSMSARTVTRMSAGIPSKNRIRASSLVRRSRTLFSARTEFFANCPPISLKAPALMPAAATPIAPTTRFLTDKIPQLRAFRD